MKRLVTSIATRQWAPPPLLRRQLPIVASDGGRHDATAARGISTLVQSKLNDRAKTLAELRLRMAGIVGAPRLFGEHVPDRSALAAFIPTEREQLPVKRLSDSYDEAWILIGADALLREQYVNHFHRVRFGRLLEDIDTFAVWLAYKHNADPQCVTGVSPIVLVTALVDRIDVSHRVTLHADRDIRMRGHVTWVGSSSCEVTIHLEQLDPDDTGSYTHVLEARLVMVAQDPTGQRRPILNPLKPVGEAEQALFELGKQHREERRRQDDESIFKRPPMTAESELLHTLFSNSFKADSTSTTEHAATCPTDSTWMSDTENDNLQLCHPQARNLYQKIFGGFLMREAFELAWCNAFMHGRARPRIVAVDDIHFRRPVQIGAVLHYSSMITYTQGNYVQMRVAAEVYDAENDERQSTNTFHFTFHLPDASSVRPVVPRSYAEAMLYVGGKRQFDEAMLHQNVGS